jgi:membrane fusion protein, copper/silver efflux system
MKRTYLTILFCTALLLSLVLSGCQEKQHSTVGVIKEIKHDEKIVVISHHAFPDGFMGAMTMSFEVTNSELFVGIKPGDQVRFTLTQQNNRYPLTAIEKVK